MAAARTNVVPEDSLSHGPFQELQIQWLWPWGASQALCRGLTVLGPSGRDSPLAPSWPRLLLPLLGFAVHRSACLPRPVLGSELAGFSDLSLHPWSAGNS